MPNILQGNQSSFNSQILEKDLGYDYPNDLDLRPSSDLHKKIKKEIYDRASQSASMMSARHTSWNEIDKFLTAYIRTDDAEKKVKEADDRKPISIIFPYSYAILETTLSYLVSAFLQDPYFKYEGFSGEDVIGAILLELVIQHNCIRNKVGIQLHTMFRDGLAYGVGPVYPYWLTRRGTRRTKREVTSFFGLNKKYGVVEEHDAILYEGNALKNIDPYLFLPDPNVPINDFQSGEFIGWVERTNYNDLLSEEFQDEDLFNIRYLKGMKGRRTSVYNEDNSGRNIKTCMGSNSTSDVFHKVDVIPMYIKIIPSEWGLSDRDRPEIWFFQLANDEVVIKARPAGFDHGMFPTTVCVPDFDGYTTSPLSRLEILGGLQTTLDWLFNSHIANVRKAINDMLIYDPYLVNSKDLKDPKPGKLIRMRRPAWGKGTKDAVTQLQVNDITRANIGDASFILDYMQKIGGTTDPVMGSLRQGGPDRLTAQEFQGTASGAVSRLERIARMTGLLAMQDIGLLFGSNTIQMMSEETYVKITGEWRNVLLNEYSGKVDRGRIKVTPFDLAINYDILVRDGSVPGGNFTDGWLTLYKMLVENPEVGSKFDMVKIFKYLARNLGAKNVNDFELAPQITPNEEVDKEVQKGNIIPISASGGI